MAHDFAPTLTLEGLYFESESTVTRTDGQTGNVLVQPEPGFSKCWIPRMDLRRFRAEYNPLVVPRGKTPEFSLNDSIQTCHDDTVSWILRRRSDGNREIRPSYQLMTRNRGHTDSMLHHTGLIGLPLFVSLWNVRPLIEMHEGRCEVDPSDAASSAIKFRVRRDEVLVEIEAIWDTTRQWFLSVKGKRWGINESLLQKLRDQLDLSEGDKQRLRTEREVVGTELYEFDEFEEAPRAGVHFPRKMVRRRENRGDIREESYAIRRWETNLEMPEDLFQPNFPAGCRIQDNRKR